MGQSPTLQDAGIEIITDETSDQTYSPKTKDEVILEMIKWLLEFKPDGWEEFLKELIGG